MKQKLYRKKLWNLFKYFFSVKKRITREINITYNNVTIFINCNIKIIKI